MIGSSIVRRRSRDQTMPTERLGAMARKDKGGGAVTSSRIAAAVFVGVAFGGLFCFLHPYDFGGTSGSQSAGVDGSSSHSVQTTSSVSQTRGPNEEATKLGEEVAALSKENKELKLKELELRRRVRELQKAATQQQAEGEGRPAKAGPPGTMKSRRTFSHVEPDESVNPALAAQLKSVAVNGELVVCVCDKAVQGSLRVWFESLKRSGVTNFLVIALDDETDAFCKDNSVHSYRRDAQISNAQKDTGGNHAISGSKFHLLREFLVLGYSVLLSDVDVVYLQNPFDFLVRDCDVESMTDGFDNRTAYGQDDVSVDPSMGWSQYAHTMRIWVFNSGLFYIRPTVASIELLDRVTDRLSRENAWDQAVFNEELFFPSSPGYEGLHASKRVLDFYLFLNSKVLFKTLRKDDRWKTHKPVTVHINYHPDKYERMLAVVDYYVLGNAKALDRFPDGSQW